jgi:hypothetical protein
MLSMPSVARGAGKTLVGKTLVSKTLADKVKEAEALQGELMTISPPTTNTKHNSTKAGNALWPIVEDCAEADAGAPNGDLDADAPAAPEAAKVCSTVDRTCLQVC